MRGSDDCFAQIAGTYLNEERTGGGAPLVEGYSRRRVCCTYRVSDLLHSFADLTRRLCLGRNFGGRPTRQKLLMQVDGKVPQMLEVGNFISKI